ncbi:MAG: hypothetical protein ABIP20_19845 [Chthoniobacteraceae bacterium]
MSNIRVRSIEKLLKLTELEDQLRFIEEGGFQITSLTASTNTTDQSEFNEVQYEGRTNILTSPLELFTAASPDTLAALVTGKMKDGYKYLFRADEVLVEGKRVPVGCLRKSIAGVGGSKVGFSDDWVNSLPLTNGVETKFSFSGLAQGKAIAWVDGSSAKAVYVMTDADIDTDGPGGGKDRDGDYNPETALHDRHGDSCDSRTFFGVVIPPSFGKYYGITVGDFAWVSWQSPGGKRISIPCQVYDVGPDDKIGEISVGLAWSLGIPPTPTSGMTQEERIQVEKAAATKGNDVKDLITVFFPKSGNRTAVSQNETNGAATALLSTLVPNKSVAPVVSANIIPANPSTRQARYDEVSARNIGTLQPDFAEKVRRWLTEMRRMGYNPYIHFAARTEGKQMELYTKFVNGVGKKAVEPRKSYHCYGRAFDWVNIKDGVAPDGLEWDNSRLYDKGTEIAGRFGIKGIGSDDNDHLQDARFSTYRDLPQAEFGQFPSPPQE